MTTDDPGEIRSERRSLERRQADRALQESVERYQSLYESLDCVYLLDFEGRFLDANLAALDLLGYERAELLALSSSSLLDDGQLAVARGVMAELKEAGSQKTAAQFRVRRKTGEYVDVEAKASVVFRDGQPYSVLGVGHDITERKQAERELQIAWHAIEHAGIGVMRLDREGRIRAVNRYLCRLLGYSREELLQMTVFDVDVRLDAGTWLGRRKELRGREPVTFESDQRTKSGQIIPVEISRSIVEFEGEEFDHAFIHDISERVRAEAALRESENRYQTLVDLSPDAIVVNVGGKYVFANQAAARLFGAGSPRDIVGRIVAEMVHPDYRELVAQRTVQVLAGAVAPPLEIKFLRLDGSPVPVEASAARIEFDGSPATQVVLRDISERKAAEEALRRAEEQLRQSQKMEAVGQLAGGIAHDFNNLLTAILGYSELILASNASSLDEVRSDIEEIKHAAERASALTQQILAFSRRQILRPTALSLNEVLKGLQSLLARTLGEDIELVTLEHSQLDPTEVDRHQFEQVLMNLALNARDAMPSGGRLTLETANVELDEEYRKAHPEVAPGPYVMLSVSDTGVGMEQETLAHAFEPFFTTKAFGEGSGLGLAVIHGIVSQSHGSISVESDPGKGTTFKIYLPRATRSHIPEEIIVPRGVSAAGSETIMVVEDEASLRSLIERILGEAGYTTLAFGSAGEALQALEHGDRPLDLLLADVMLPGALQGHDLARAVLASRPDLPVLYISGYAREALGRAGRLDEGVNLLEKPFTPEALVTMVRQVLDRPHTPG